MFKSVSFEPRKNIIFDSFLLVFKLVGIVPRIPRDFHAIGSQNATKIKPPCVFVRRRSFESLERWVTTWTPVRNQTVSLFNFVWHMCGRLVGGVGPKMKSCYLLRVKQRLAFCCPLLPNKLFSVFWEVRLLLGVLSFACSTVETHFATRLCGICVAKPEKLVETITRLRPRFRVGTRLLSQPPATPQWRSLLSDWNYWGNHIQIAVHVTCRPAYICSPETKALLRQ